jgi:hypothetical protein
MVLLALPQKLPSDLPILLSPFIVVYLKSYITHFSKSLFDWILKLGVLNLLLCFFKEYTSRIHYFLSHHLSFIVGFTPEDWGLLPNIPGFILYIIPRILCFGRLLLKWVARDRLEIFLIIKILSLNDFLAFFKRRLTVKMLKAFHLGF